MHKRSCAKFLAPVDQFCNARSRHACLSVFGFFVAGAGHVAAELDWARQRKSSCYHKSNLQELRKISGDLFRMCGESEWVKCFGYENINFLAGYRALSEAEGGQRSSFFLSQDPQRHPHWPRHQPDQLPPMSVAPLLWAEMECVSDSRLVCARERLLFQAFATFPEFTCYGEGCSFLRPNPRRTLPSMVRQSGCTVNSNVVGIFLVYALCFIKVGGQQIHNVERVDDLGDFLEGLVRKPKSFPNSKMRKQCWNCVAMLLAMGESRIRFLAMEEWKTRLEE